MDRSSAALLAAGLVAVVLAIGAAVLVGAAAGGVAPGSDATIATTSFTVPAFEAASASVACPAGTRVVGGGVDTTGPTPEGGGAIPYHTMLSGPLDETGLTANTVDGDVARFWFAYVRNGTDSAKEFRVLALCSSTSDAVVAVQAFTLLNTQSTTATAICTAGSRVVGGGVGTTGPAPSGNALPYDLQLSGPQDETALTATTEDGDVGRFWFAAVRNVSTAAQDFKVIALCSKSSDASLEVETVPVASNGTVSMRAACPAGGRVLGGGFGTTGPSPTGPGFRLYLTELSAPQDETGLAADAQAGDAARSWRAYIHNDSGAPQTFKAVAICSHSVVPPGPGPAAGGAGGGGQGGAGGATLRCAGATATIRGTAGADRIRGTARRDVIAGGAGADRIAGLGGDDLICGGPGDDSLSGGGGWDRLFGLAGDDRLLGGPGRDALRGGAGRDRLLGGPGLDALVGGPGRDLQAQ